MEAPRRRSLMPQATEATSNGRLMSGIPMPSTVKKSNNMRMSTANNGLRTPAIGTAAPPSLNPRQSIARPNPLLMSVSKPSQAGGRTPLNASIRRQSVWGPGPAQPSQNIANQGYKDPRPVRDKSYQQRMRQDILAYLQRNGVDIVTQTLTDIQAKDFRSIFNYLIGILDPDFPFNPTLDYAVKHDVKADKDKQARGREDEFMLALASVRYPFVSEIKDKKWITSPGAMHTWPTLLGLLHWLVEACKIREEYFNMSGSTTQNVANVPDEFDDPQDHRAIAFEYYDVAYEQWLDEIDDPVEAREKLEEKYAKKNERMQKDLDSKLAELAQLEKEYKHLRSTEPPIVKLENDNKVLKDDSQKFVIICQTLVGKRDKLRATTRETNLELEARAKKLETMHVELAETAEIVKAQNLSVDEVESMRRDHDTLTRQLDDLEAKVREAHHTVMALEVSFSNRAHDAEQQIDSYMNYLTKVGLFPHPPSPWKDIELALELRSGAPDPEQMLSGPSIETVIKPALTHVAETRRKERADNEDERVRLDHEFDRIHAENENLEDELNMLEKQVATLNEQAEALREAAQQDSLQAGQQASKLEKDLQNARNAALATGMGLKSRVSALQIEYNEQKQKVQRLKDETIAVILKNSNDIATFKNEVSQCLFELKEFAEGS
ncbi:HEC/Ndc80p family-domain-containing protein [Flagelloscypha sp. PMI_526]|nr:HEC/Ndc80p family-domain-containing protein [Flagelloscypha sp. PMI_526]